MRSQLPVLTNYEDLVVFTKQNGREAAIEVLRLWVALGQPSSFAGGLTSRRMCTAVAEGVCGYSAMEEGSYYLGTPGAVDIYSAMWNTAESNP